MERLLRCHPRGSLSFNPKHYITSICKQIRYLDYLQESYAAHMQRSHGLL